ncbi:hypothetical protein PF004_g24351 [Phytophthora fragariae]|uniref:Pectate lyase n=1 Tax=Phytophthora fragariae TaxID=53985 RepID=A0A6G0MVE6_9STRA|nr:hypothetical protein PF004_g24351 [Phytophthora fragariae]KAE9296455.1 hypothetical protein PF008_g23998 [Phytophthora fragariae]
MSYGIIVFVLNVIAVQGDTDTCTNVWTSSGKERTGSDPRLGTPESGAQSA